MVRSGLYPVIMGRFLGRLSLENWKFAAAAAILHRFASWAAIMDSFRGKIGEVDMRARQTGTLDQQLQFYGTIARRRTQDSARAGAGCPVPWKRFAAAAGATLAGMTTAEAAINHVVPPSPIRATLYDNPIGINLDGIGGEDMQINAGIYYATPTYHFRFIGSARGLGDVSLIGGETAGPYGNIGVRRFEANAPIPPVVPATAGSILHVSATRYGTLFTYAAQFPASGTGFAGFVNDVGGSLHAGWIKIRTETAGGNLFAVSVLEWAFQTVPGLSVLAGQTGAVGIPGDYNNNGTVGPEDYALWKSTFGQSVTAGTGADGNSNALVDAADYTVCRDNLNSAGSGAQSGAVPEPSTVTLGVLALGAAGVAALRRRSR